MVAPTKPLPPQTIGTARRNLIEPCGDHPSPPYPQREPEDAIALSFSGGGWRAALTAAGALRFLADAGLLERVRWVSSVSGGSITNGLLAVSYEDLEQAGFDPELVDERVLGRASLGGTRRIAHLGAAAERLASVGPDDPDRRPRASPRSLVLLRAPAGEPLAGCRFTFNAANETTGVRFGFDRDFVGDYVIGRIPTAETTVRVATAVAASASVPGPFAATRFRDLTFPCGAGADVRLLDGGVYDNLGLESIDGLWGPCLIVVSAGGVLRTGMSGLISKLPIIRDLKRSSALLYRQATTLRVRTMIERFRAWEDAKRSGRTPPDYGRQGVLFGLATTLDQPAAAWVAKNPVPTSDGERLAEVKTTFSRLPGEICEQLVYRGWWLTGASLATFHPQVLGELPSWRPLP